MQYLIILINNSRRNLFVDDLVKSMHHKNIITFSIIMIGTSKISKKN